MQNRTQAEDDEVIHKIACLWVIEASIRFVFKESAMGAVSRKKMMVFVFCFSFCFSLCSNAAGAGKVLLVHSYEAGYLWTDDITRGVKKGLEGADAELEIFYMDSRRYMSEEWRIQAGKLAMRRLGETRPDVVITADDDAQAYFGKFYIGQAYPQIVFCGVNAQPSEYGYPASNVTGIIERPFFEQCFDMLKVIVPAAKNVAVIGDASPTSKNIITFMKTRNLPIPITSIDEPETFAQWEDSIRNYQKTVDAICIVLYHTLLKEPGGVEVMPPKEVMSWTLANNTKPLFSVAPFCVEDGAIFGVVNSAFEQGFEAARIASEILKGIKASEFHILSPSKGAVWLNIRTAENMGFEIPFDIIRSTDKIID